MDVGCLVQLVAGAEASEPTQGAGVIISTSDSEVLVQGVGWSSIVVNNRRRGRSSSRWVNVAQLCAAPVEPNAFPVEHLPMPVLSNVLAHLPLHEVAAFQCRTCKRWLAAFRDATVWRGRCTAELEGVDVDAAFAAQQQQCPTCAEGEGLLRLMATHFNSLQGGIFTCTTVGGPSISRLGEAIMVGRAT